MNGEKQWQPTEELKHGRLEALEDELSLEPFDEDISGIRSKTTRGFETSKELKRGSRAKEPWYK